MNFQGKTRGIAVREYLDGVWGGIGHYIGQRIEQMRDGVERGESVLRTAVAAGIFTTIVLQMIAVGDETGELDSLLREVAVDGSKTYFDTNTSDHHHYVCGEDGTIFDVPGGSLRVTGLPAPPEGMEIARVDGDPIGEAPEVAQRLKDAGFTDGYKGLTFRA